MDIVKAFKTAYGKDLIEEIKSETSGNFEKVLVALLRESIEFYAIELDEAMRGVGTDEDTLIDIMCTKNNREIRLISGAYERLFKKKLEDSLASETSGNLKKIMISLSTAHRDDSMVINTSAASLDANELKRAGIDKWGTDESSFIEILCTRNFAQLKLIANEYEKLTGHTLEKDIKSEFSGDVERALLTILSFVSNPLEYFAERLYKSMAGLGTNDKNLIRLIVSRCEIDMVDIKREFEKKYQKTLRSFIDGDTSGYYKNTLYALTGEDRRTMKQ